MLSFGIFILRFAEAITLQLTLNEAVGHKCKVLQVEGNNFHKVLLLYLQRKYKAEIGSYSNIPSSSNVNIFEVKNIVEMIKIRMSWEVKITNRGYYMVAWRYEFYFRVAKQYFTNEHSEWVKHCFCHKKIKFISSSRRVNVLFII